MTRAYGFPAERPLSKEQRKGIALCLSGGGYRAALFHLGALRRLDELGVLSQIDTITSVSGGSIMNAQIAGHVAKNPDAWGNPRGPVKGFEEGIVEPMRRLSTRDIRTKAVLSKLKPWNWRNQNAQIDVLAETLSDGTPGTRIAVLPDRPRFVFCATDVCFRGQWTADSGTKKVGHGLCGYAPVGDWTIARAAAASSCLPGAFEPMRIDDPLADGTYAEADRDTLLKRIDLTDGGVYDNLGLEPVWRDHAAVLVSDAAPAFKPEPGIGGLWKELRYAVTLLEQATDVRKRWLIEGFRQEQLAGTFWGIASHPDDYDFDQRPKTYSDALIRDFISQVRIDLDVFSEGERGVLENHGYLMADIAVRKHLAGLVVDGPPPSPPYPDWLDEARARDALKESHLTKAFARGWR